MDNHEMIVVKQLPIIEQQLKEVSAEIDEKVKNAVALVCTEENVKTIKEVRANLNKEAKEFEDKRKQVKAEIMKPYEDFEKVYKECIIDKYKTADIELKNKIDSVENELKTNKKTEVITYFNEYLNSKNIDFITFEQVNINVTLTASMKSLKEQAKNFIDKIADDLNLIDTQEHKTEILVEYKQSLNVSQAITTVTNRFKAIEEEKTKIEREKGPLETVYIPANEMPVESEIDNDATNSNKIHISVDKPLDQPLEENEEVLTLKFTVRGTRTQLKALKEFLESGGYDYE